MNSITRILGGHLNQTELRRYVIIKAAVFWSLIFLAWLMYPAENKYSIRTHTFSFLGSFETKHSPDWWWIFTIAMVFWGCATFPLVFYHRRRFLPISRIGANIGAFFLAVGAVNVVLVGLFPDARAEVIGSIRWTEIHEKVAVFVGVGFLLGILWHGGMILRDRFGARHFADHYPAAYRRLALPYLVWGVISAIGIGIQIRWAFVYETMKAAAAAKGEDFGSSWSEAMGTIYSFPLWENILIYALFGFLVWFALEVPASATTAGRGED